MSESQLRYQSGFGNEFASEAAPGALPQGRNSPQQAPHGLYAELLSGTAFTAPRAVNRRTWMYRRQPSVVSGAYVPYAQPLWTSGAAGGVDMPPDPLRWNPFQIPDAPLDFVDGIRTLVANGDPLAQAGMAALVYTANRSMKQRALVNADGEMLFVPQQGRLRITTELGRMEVAPGEIALLPRGLAFRIELPDGPSRGYACENYGAHFRLPELGPIGSNGLANARDFQTPVAAHEPDTGPVEVIRKFGGRLWCNTQAATPFNVVAWHGNLVPCTYDTARFMTIGTVSYD
ncbi:MAG TPA: homogentisate 1,2-dioxygenase, partial [Burkholderiaceae bacterium]